MRDPGHRFIRGDQQACGVFDSQFCQIVPWGDARFFMKDTVKIIFCQMYVRSDVLQGNLLRKMVIHVLEILKNRELIAINQDPLCKQAVVVKEYRGGNQELLAEVWVKPLKGAGGSRTAIAFLNRSRETLEIEVDYSTAGIAGEIQRIRDISSQSNLQPDSQGGFRVEVASHGVVIYEVESSLRTEIVDLNEHLEWSRNLPEKITNRQMEDLMKEGALLIDVRNPAEYEKGHLEQVVNIPYQDLFLKTEKLLPDKERKVILYCATGKRSLLAKMLLDRKGYKEVNYLGGIY